MKQNEKLFSINSKLRYIFEIRELGCVKDIFIKIFNHILNSVARPEAEGKIEIQVPSRI